MFVYCADVPAESYKLPSHRQCVDVGRNRSGQLFNLRNVLSILFSFSVLSCSNNTITHPEKRMAITKYEILKDSADLASILNQNPQKQKSKFDYRDFVGKIFLITFSNNSNENMYLLRPLLQEASDTMFKDFTASIHLIQVSNDSLNWENVFYRQPVDIYDAGYDTLTPKSTISKIAFLDNNRSKYLKILLEYRSDSSYFNDTISITNRK